MHACLNIGLTIYTCFDYCNRHTTYSHNIVYKQISTTNTVLEGDQGEGKVRVDEKITQS